MFYSCCTAATCANMAATFIASFGNCNNLTVCRFALLRLSVLWCPLLVPPFGAPFAVKESSKDCTGFSFFGGLQLNQKLIAFAYTAAAAASAAAAVAAVSLSVAAAHHGCGFQRLAVSTFNQSQQKKGPTVVYCTSSNASNTSNFLAAATAGAASGCWTVGAQSVYRIYRCVYIFISIWQAAEEEAKAF